jgi:hypothetical protein
MTKSSQDLHGSELPHFDLGAFLRKHNRILTFVGALVVFLTFVIKEGLREHLKDLVEALGSAQNIFRIRNENAEMLGLLERIAVASGTAGSQNPDSPVYLALRLVHLMELQTAYRADLPVAAMVSDLLLLAGSHGSTLTQTNFVR